jgi:hypothetical protein
MEISQGLSRGSGATPGSNPTISWHPVGCQDHRNEKSPVVTLASLANHRLIFLHPSGVPLPWLHSAAAPRLNPAAWSE